MLFTSLCCDTSCIQQHTYCETSLQIFYKLNVLIALWKFPHPSLLSLVARSIDPTMQGNHICSANIKGPLVLLGSFESETVLATKPER